MTNDLNTLLFCPVCNKKYSHGSARTVASKDESVIVHITCSFCKTASLAVMSTAQGTESVITVGMLTDLSFDEMINMVKEGPITADEVLEISQSPGLF